MVGIWTAIRRVVSAGSGVSGWPAARTVPVRRRRYGQQAARGDGDVEAVEQGEVRVRAQQVHPAEGALLLPEPRDLSQPLAGGQRLRGRQVTAGQGPGALRIGAGLHPGLPLRSLTPASSGVRVDRQDRPLQRGAQLPGGQAPGTGEYPRLDHVGVTGIQLAEHVDQDPGARQIDLPGLHRCCGGRALGQIEGEVQLDLGGHAGQRQRGGQLRGDELAQSGRELTRHLGGRGAVGRAAPGQRGDRGELPRLRPGGQSAPGSHHSDQAVVVQPAIALLVRVVREGRQRHPGRQHVQRPAVGEPAARPGAVLARPGQPRRTAVSVRRLVGQRPDRSGRRRGGRGGQQLVQLRAGQAGQLGRRARVGVQPERRVIALLGFPRVGLEERGQLRGQDLVLAVEQVVVGHRDASGYDARADSSTSSNTLAHPADSFAPTRRQFRICFRAIRRITPGAAAGAGARRPAPPRPASATSLVSACGPAAPRRGSSPRARPGRWPAAAWLPR